MGLLDVLNGMRNGPRGQPDPGVPGTGGIPVRVNHEPRSTAKHRSAHRSARLTVAGVVIAIVLVGLASLYMVRTPGA